VLAGILNFRPSPTWFQVIAWVCYVAVVVFFYVRQHRSPQRTAAVAPAPRSRVAS
jgi:high-affinity iron transporter